MNITKQSLEQIECGNGGFIRELINVYRIVKERPINNAVDQVNRVTATPLS